MALAFGSHDLRGTYFLKTQHFFLLCREMKTYFQSDDSQSYEYLYYRKKNFLTFPAGDDIQIYILIWNNSLGHVMADGSTSALFHIISEA